MEASKEFNQFILITEKYFQNGLGFVGICYKYLGRGNLRLFSGLDMYIQ